MSKIIGLGAAGNKAVIEAIEAGTIPKSHCLLINSTLKDIPSDYHDISVNIGGDRGGCGKEREVGKELTIESIKDGTLDILDQLIEPNDEMIYLASSTEGGSGSGSISIISKYFKEMYNLNVNITAFTGFEDDARGMLNTIEFFKDLSDEYIVQVISNKKFLEDANNNKMKAQQLANREFNRRLAIMLGLTIVDSDNNIDETDLYKVLSTPGLITSEHAILDRSIKNNDQFNKVVSDMIDNTKTVDIIDPQSKRIAVILNIKPSTEDAIDFSFDIIKQKLGYPYELFTHVQDEGDSEFINIISSGMRMPTDELIDIYNKYQEKMQNINKSKDSFFNSIRDLDDGSSDMFNSARRTVKFSNPDTEKAKKKSFLDSFKNNSSSVSSSEDIKSRKDDFTSKY